MQIELKKHTLFVFDNKENTKLIKDEAIPVHFASEINSKIFDIFDFENAKATYINSNLYFTNDCISVLLLKQDSLNVPVQKLNDKLRIITSKVDELDKKVDHKIRCMCIFFFIFIVILKCIYFNS